MFDEHVSTAITLWTDFYTFFCFTAASAVELIVWVIGWLPACPSACHQTFSNQYFYSFCQIPTELGTRDLCASAEKNWNRFSKVWFKIFGESLNFFFKLLFLLQFCLWFLWNFIHVNYVPMCKKWRTNFQNFAFKIANSKNCTFWFSLYSSSSIAI